MIYNGKEHIDRETAWPSIHADLSDLPGTVDRCVERLHPHADKFDSIVVQGMSGVIVGSPVSLALGKPLVVVRKPLDYHHNEDEVINEHRVGARYLFLDDFISAGTTYGRVTQSLDGISDCAGRYLYSYDELEIDGSEVTPEFLADYVRHAA